MTESQRALLTRIVAALSADERILGAWLGGSFARGNADAFSDLDVYLAVEDVELASLQADLDALLARLGPLVFRRFLPGSRDRVVVAITEDWQRFDLSLVPRSELETRPFPHALPLFDRATIVESLRRDIAPTDINAGLRRTIEESLRVLGLLPVVLGREEYVVAVDGVGLLRRLLIELYLIANNVTDRGGALRLNPYLTPEQRSTLEGLPPLVATREAVVDGHVALVRAFVPLARRLAANRGLDYPTAFERATLRHVGDSIGVALDS